jgi:hypothetical protein
MAHDHSSYLKDLNPKAKLLASIGGINSQRSAE